jgi:hypothetical protein
MALRYLQWMQQKYWRPSVSVCWLTYKGETKVHDFYDYINSPDVAAHCRGLGCKFNLLEKAVILHYSNVDIIETLVAMRELLRDEEDMTVPKSIHYDEIPSLKKWIRWCVEEVEQGVDFDRGAPDEEWCTHFLDDFFIYVPTPFKRGDIICRPARDDSDEDYPGRVFVLPEDLDAYPLRRLAEEPRDRTGVKVPFSHDGSDMFMLPAYFVDEKGLIDCDHMEAQYTDLEYFHGALKGHDRALEFLSHYVKDEIALWQLIGMQNKILLEEIAGSYEYVVSCVEYTLSLVKGEGESCR